MAAKMYAQVLAQHGFRVMVTEKQAEALSSRKGNVPWFPALEYTL